MRKYVNALSRLSMLSLLLIAAAHADNSHGPQGAGYRPLSPPQPTNSGNKVEVVEIFSYACIHCAQFQPYVDAWHKKVDKNAVQFTYVPATFNPQYKMLARGYYAAESMGLVSATHQRVFNAIFIDGKRVNTLDDLVKLYASFGVDANKFRQVAQSFFVETQLRRADELMRSYRIDGTPTVIVAGKYSVSGESAGGNDKIMTVVDQLIAKERPAAKSKAK
jgi:thiol:disulfide interchange protein DsbA